MNTIAYITIFVIIAAAPIVLWVAAEVTHARLTFRILAGVCALAMTSLVVHWATIFTPAHEQAVTRYCMARLQESLRQGKTNLVYQALAEFNKVAATGDTFNALGMMSKKLEILK